MNIGNYKSLYVCPRCNHKTGKKTDMSRHLHRIRLCPNRNDLELNEEIIQYVLRHHEYHHPKLETGQNINNFNMMVGVVNSTETLDKLKLLSDHQKVAIMDIENDLEKKYEYLVKRLENNEPTCAYLLTLDDLFNVINNCTQRETGEPERFNVFFDKVINRLKLFRGRSWETFLEDAGIKQLVSLIKSYYLDSYEIYLIRNIHSTNGVRVNRWQLKDHLSVYYRFLSCFDIDPHIITLEDDEVMGYQLVGGRSDFLSTTYQKLYNDEKKEQKESVAKSIKKKIINIVKDNSVQNVKTLDKAIIELLKIDQVFRKELLKTKQIT